MEKVVHRSEKVSLKHRVSTPRIVPWKLTGFSVSVCISWVWYTCTMLWFCHLCGVLAGGLLQRTGGNSGWAEGCQIDVLSGSLNQSEPQHTEIGIFRQIFDQLIFSQVLYMCIHRLMCSRLICPLFSEFSCDFYQAHFHNIFSLSQHFLREIHMLKTATSAEVRAVAPTSSAKNQDALVFKIIRCGSWPAHFRAPMCEVRSAKCAKRIPSAWMGL